MARGSELERLGDGEAVLVKSDEGPGNGSRSRKLKLIEEISRSDTAILLKAFIDEEERVAKVFRCEEPEAATRVADSFDRESMVLERLEHSNIVRVLYSDARPFALYLETLPWSLEKLMSESKKLMAESKKLIAESEKLISESKK